MEEQEMMDRVKMKNLINQDPAFYKRFKEEWEEITRILRQIHEASKRTDGLSKTKEIFRPTSGAVMYKR